MRIFVAGATGALGKQLVPQLVEAGHEVTAMTRSESKTGLLREMGAEPVVADALDADAVGAAVAAAEPDVVINQLTAISDDPDWRNPDREFAQTNRLRTEGTDILLSAAIAAGARRYIGQSFTGWPFAREGSLVKDEDAPLTDDPPKGVVEMLAAISHLESAVTGAEGIEGVVLRYGGFYGPNTSLAAHPDGSMVETVRKRKLPLVGKGSGMWSFVHIADAASATSRLWSGAGRGSTPWWTTSPLRFRSGFRSWPGRSARRSRCGSLRSSGASSPAPRRS